jgi:ubiquinone/menaquinone biosynthesis C-methylase UbiE
MSAAHANEQHAAAAFTGQAAVFDELYNADTIINYKRARVRRHILKHLAPGSSILELNCGTGEDATWFAKKGFKVHATDISAGMLYQLVQKRERFKLQRKVSFELCSYTNLAELKNRGPYDLIFSNLAGLNCSGELDKVLASLPELLKPNGMITLVMLPKFCLWEALLVFKGKFRTAFRRFFSRQGRKARVEGAYFKCWYYNPSYIIKRLKDRFELLGLEGLCTIVPPSYMEGFAEKHPAIYKFLRRKENHLKSQWLWRVIGDYYIVSMRKKA